MLLQVVFAVGSFRGMGLLGLLGKVQGCSGGVNEGLGCSNSFMSVYGVAILFKAFGLRAH